MNKNDFKVILVHLFYAQSVKIGLTVCASYEACGNQLAVNSQTICPA